MSASIITCIRVSRISKITSYEINTKAMVKVALEKALKQIRGAASGKNMEIVSGQLVPKESVKL